MKAREIASSRWMALQDYEMIARTQGQMDTKPADYLPGLTARAARNTSGAR